VAGITDYAQLYLQGMIATNTGNQALYSKRLLEYTMAKDAGEKALNELSIRWQKEDQDSAKPMKTWTIVGIILGIIFGVIFFVLPRL
jgi:hypothetical protein